MGKEQHLIRVDTLSLREYADRLHTVNLQTEKLKVRLEAVCAASGMPDLQNQLQLQTLIAGQADVERCIRYLRDTAGDFEALERELSGKL
jgi:hypothetical protein